jgi:hypothetical protein
VVGVEGDGAAVVGPVVGLDDHALLAPEEVDRPAAELDVDLGGRDAIAVTGIRWRRVVSRLPRPPLIGKEEGGETALGAAPAQAPRFKLPKRDDAVLPSGDLRHPSVEHVEFVTHEVAKATGLVSRPPTPLFFAAFALLGTLRAG